MLGRQDRGLGAQEDGGLDLQEHGGLDLQEDGGLGVEDPCVWREVEIAAEPERVWEAIATEEGRESWLDDDLERSIEIVESEPPRRLVWSWGADDEEPRRVELLVVASPAGSRVIVIESAGPSLPLTMLAQACAPALALV